jgi:hypothetical protein
MFASSLAVVAVDMLLPSQVGCMAENDVAVAAITSRLHVLITKRRGKSDYV